MFLLDKGPCEIEDQEGFFSLFCIPHVYHFSVFGGKRYIWSCVFEVGAWCGLLA